MASSSSSSPDSPERTFEYVGFWKRFVAFLIDSMIVLVVLIPLMLLVHTGSEWAQLGNYMERAFAGPLEFVIQVVLPIVALLMFWRFRSATPGKMAIGARIVDAKTSGEPSNKQLLVRFLGYFVSLFLLGLGFIWIGIDRRKQGFHDKIAGTVVVYED